MKTPEPPHAWSRSLSKIPLIPPVLLFLAACGHRTPQEALGPKAVIVVDHPRRLQDFQRIALSGTLTPPSASSQVAFLVPGRALQVLPREGEAVRKGQVLAVLDSQNLRHGLDAAHAQVEAARAGAQQSEQEYQRMKQLFENQSLPPNDFAKFTAAREASRQQLQQALAGEGVARKNLADATLLAPLSGFIARRMLEPGVMVSPGQPVFEIAELDPIEINVGVPETEVRLLRVGQSATLTVPALPGRQFTGKVQVVNVSADPATRTYMTRIQVPNAGRDLKPGMVAEASITGSERRDLTLVPIQAIVRDAQGAPQVYQFYPAHQRVYAKRVELGALVGQEIEVRSGLQGDETIVVSGQHALRNGMLAEPTAVKR